MTSRRHISSRRFLLALSTVLISLVGSTQLSGQLKEADFTHASWTMFPIKCDAYGCQAAPGESPVEQLTLFSTCLAGPDGWVSYECSCADISMDSRADLWDYALFQNYLMPVCERKIRIEQAPGLGFCPLLDAIHQAYIYEAYDGTLLVVGSRFIEQVLVRDESPPDQELGGYGRVLFGPIELTGEETASLTAMLEAIPPHPECPDWICDPCRVITFEFDGRIVRDDCTPCPETIIYSDHIRRVFDYINGIINN